MLNMFRTLIHPSSGACDFSIVSPHWLCVLVSMCVGVLVWLSWSGIHVVGFSNGALYLYQYLYFPYGPYSLYRASVSVQWCTLPLPIPLLPLWTLQPVQSLSVCTMVHFTFTFTWIFLCKVLFNIHFYSK